LGPRAACLGGIYCVLCTTWWELRTSSSRRAWERRTRRISCPFCTEQSQVTRAPRSTLGALIQRSRARSSPVELDVRSSRERDAQNREIPWRTRGPGATIVDPVYAFVATRKSVGRDTYWTVVSAHAEEMLIRATREGACRLGISLAHAAGVRPIGETPAVAAL
jgi:hypothetical protein